MEPELELVNLETIRPGAFFLCPWNGKTFELEGITPSAAWVKVEEEIEFEVKDKKTGLIKVIKTKKKQNQPWSRGTKVKAL